MKSKKRLVLCHEISVSSTGELPTLIPVFPAGKKIVGRDGREYLNPNPFKIIANTRARGTQTPIDFNHLSENKGGEGRAIGWVKDFILRSDGSVWGEVSEWSEEAEKALKERAFRYISPAFFTLDDPEGETRGIISEISSIALVNSPNFDLPALNNETGDNSARENEPNPSNEVPSMDPKELRKSLGLAETATENEVTARVEQLTAATKEEKPELNSAEIGELIRSEIQKAVAPIVNTQNETHAELATRTIEGYVQAGKIPPAEETRKYWLEQASTAEGLKRACAYLDQLPKMVSTEDVVKGNPTTKTELNAEQKKICKMIGVSEEDFLKTDIESMYGEVA